MIKGGYICHVGLGYQAMEVLLGLRVVEGDKNSNVAIYVGSHQPNCVIIPDAISQCVKDIRIILALIMTFATNIIVKLELNRLKQTERS
jgi:hypothetical protein